MRYRTVLFEFTYTSYQKLTITVEATIIAFYQYNYLNISFNGLSIIILLKLKGSMNQIMFYPYNI